MWKDNLLGMAAANDYCMLCISSRGTTLGMPWKSTLTSKLLSRAKKILTPIIG